MCLQRQASATTISRCQKRRNGSGHRLLPAVHGTRNGAVWRRRQSEHVRFGALETLETWVEKRTALERIIARGNVQSDSSKKMTRPLCFYPNTARYKGTGQQNDAANFECVMQR